MPPAPIQLLNVRRRLQLLCGLSDSDSPPAASSESEERGVTTVTALKSLFSHLRATCLPFLRIAAFIMQEISNIDVPASHCQPSAALRAQLSKQMSRREPRLNMNPDMNESMADTLSAKPQPGSDEGAVVTEAVPSTSPVDEKTDSRCGVNKIASFVQQLRSMKVRTTATNVSKPVPDVH
ncbi:hypothetical protein SprV_0200935300 [Sparganum proliferum]